MREIKDLKPGDQATVVQFDYKLDAERREQIARGFYGTQADGQTSRSQSAEQLSEISGSEK
jgi:hypothetical protein